MATLAGLVQSLPAELYNEIYELTFTKTSTVVQVDKGYRPPSTLHVNRATREFRRGDLHTIPFNLLTLD